MPLAPIDWNVIVAGWWNRAILTPLGIVTRVFGQPAGTQIALLVPANLVAPVQVGLGGLKVMVDRTSLTIALDINDYRSLEGAMERAARAIQELPETPLIAAGFNIRYQGAASDPGLARLLESVGNSWDARLATAGLQMDRREISKVVQWNAGKILINAVHEQTGAAKVNINFECSADGNRTQQQNVEAMLAWLRQPIDGVRRQIEAIVTNILGLDRGVLP